MNTGIKFRCWNTTHKEMNSDSYAKLILYKESVGENILDCKVLRFTGIKDITDKDIYEGDILKVGENLVCEIVYIEKNVEDYGDEIHSAFHAKVYTHNKTIPLDSYLKNNCVLIGNVYENPELVGDVF